jgi:hypothetical protein
MEVIQSFKGLSGRDTLIAIVGLYLAQIIVVKVYQVFIYPYYVSPLRRLPGPKVIHTLLSVICSWVD